MCDEFRVILTTGWDYFPKEHKSIIDLCSLETDFVSFTAGLHCCVLF
jgi:hypothetical protein